MVEGGGAEKKNCSVGGMMGLGWSVWGEGELLLKNCSL